MKQTDIRITRVTIDFEHYDYRTVMKFGGVEVDQATILNVHIDVVSREGKTGRGFGSMPLSNIWAYPSQTRSHDETLGSMTTLANQFAQLASDHDDFGHPVDLGVQLEHRFLENATALSNRENLDPPIPKLAALVTGSPFDAAIHDAYGKLHGVNCYQTYGPEWMTHDAGHYLGEDYRGEWISNSVSETAKPSMPLYHLVGALDPLDEMELTTPTDDGLPNTLAQWIRHNGLTHMKIKLNGDDVNWDVQRVVKVDRIASEVQSERGIDTWHYSLDFNERCPNVDYLIEVLERIKAASPQGFDRIQYVEQPTARDLQAHPDNKMHRAAAIKPVVIDESLTDLETLLLARDMGYTGAALKACKGQTQSLLMAVAIKKLGMFLCVQDLTCPGASLIHSAGLAAHIPGVAAIEANSRQYCPAANRGWEQRFPGIFSVRDGSMDTRCLDGLGLSAC
ncbi:enolase C-terminal domain-like protein [Rhodopirellula sp. MGV]|uniref:enolase C-terminal domain-like protein n=1 Tax=Rhodopirellula sp. MGV TaxID=2023130 RepID=UPI000B971012|nr:enolase C-terminal domain-like protein [Rhodopirellula sp. MGV]OYP29388.1 hypothetical protein CGZ80_24570 [Rhodopirellula sp. MGV]PNY35694.1 hypothetical protein C2E31_16525 [Rhodopirellula baltica]